MNKQFWGEFDGPQPDAHEELQQRGKRSLIAIVAVSAIVTAILLLAPLWAHAQTFTASVTSGQAPLSTVLTWSVPDAITCTAGDTPGWRGSVPTSGTRTLTSIGINLRLTLACVMRGSALLTWVHGAPVAGADVTAWRLLWGDSAATLTQTLDVNVPGATSFRIDGIALGPKAFAVRALAGSRESINSNVVTRDVAGVPWSSAIDITILAPPDPNPPVLTVTDALAYEIFLKSGVLTARAVGAVKFGAPCLTDTQKVGTITYHRVPIESVDKDVRLNQPQWRTNADLKFWARCG